MWGTVREGAAERREGENGAESYRRVMQNAFGLILRDPMRRHRRLDTISEVIPTACEHETDG